MSTSLPANATKIGTVTFTVPVAQANIRADTVLYVNNQSGGQRSANVYFVIDGNTTTITTASPLQLLTGFDTKYLPLNISLPPGQHTIDLNFYTDAAAVKCAGGGIFGIQFFS